MSATDGEEVGPLLDEQRAYYRALAADYWTKLLARTRPGRTLCIFWSLVADCLKPAGRVSTWLAVGDRRDLNPRPSGPQPYQERSG